MVKKVELDQNRLDVILRKVSNLFATLYLYDQSPTLLDRLANALSKEAVAKVLYEAQRIIQMGLNNKDIWAGKINKDNKELPAVFIKKSDKLVYNIIGYLPNDQDIADFLNLTEKDVYYARKTGALAMSTCNSVLNNQGGSQ